MTEFHSIFVGFVPEKISDKVTALLIGWYLIYCNATAQAELSELFELRYDQLFMSCSHCGLSPDIKVGFSILSIQSSGNNHKKIGNLNLQAEPAFFTPL